MQKIIKKFNYKIRLICYNKSCNHSQICITDKLKKESKFNKRQMISKCLNKSKDYNFKALSGNYKQSLLGLDRNTGKNNKILYSS